ncbi:unnamed protein product [Caenorhabditis nigoni]
MSSSGSVSSGLDLDALEEWATTTIATVERGVEEKLAEMDSKVQKSNLKVVMLEGQLAMSELNRKAEEDARKMLEGQMEHDRINFGNSKEEWFVNDRKKDEKINELENTVKALTEEKEAHILKIATLDDQWRGAVKQAIEDRVEFGKKTKESEEAMRELNGKVEMLEKELVQQRNRVCEMSQLMEQEKANGMQSKMEYDVEAGKTREEVERLQGLLKNLEEKNGAMKNVIEILEQDKKTQSEKIKELECTAIQFHNKRLELEETIESKDKAAGELIAKLVGLEMELVQKRKDLRDISLANQNEKIDLKKISEDHALEIGKLREEVGRLQESLRELEEENGMMKNLIESLREDKETQSQGLRLEMVGMQQAVMNMEAEMEDLQEQHRQDFTKLQATMGNELAQKEELILELTSKVQESETKIQNVSKDHKEKMEKLQEELKTQKALLGEQRIMEAQKIEKAERERSLLKQTIKDLSTALESIRKDQKWIPMLEEQLEDADKQLESEKTARKLDSETKTAEVRKLIEAIQRLQEKYAQEQELRNQMESAQRKSEEEKKQSNRSIRMLEEQLENADQQLESEKAARKLEIDAKSAEIGRLNEAYQTELNRLQEQCDQEQDLRNQLNSKYIEMETARIQSEEEKEAVRSELERTKNELAVKENEVKMLIEHVEKEAKEAAERHAKFQNMLKRKHDDRDEVQDPVKRRALEHSYSAPRPGTF